MGRRRGNGAAVAQALSAASEARAAVGRPHPAAIAAAPLVGGGAPDKQHKGLKALVHEYSESTAAPSIANVYAAKPHGSVL